jgi:hypothetical protein
MPMKPAEHEARCCFCAEAGHEHDDDGDDDADQSDRFVLTRKIGFGARLNRGGNFLHARVTGREAIDP